MAARPADVTAAVGDLALDLGLRMHACRRAGRRCATGSGRAARTGASVGPGGAGARARARAGGRGRRAAGGTGQRVRDGQRARGQARLHGRARNGPFGRCCGRSCKRSGRAHAQADREPMCSGHVHLHLLRVSQPPEQAWRPRTGGGRAAASSSETSPAARSPISSPPTPASKGGRMSEPGLYRLAAWSRCARTRLRGRPRGSTRSRPRPCTPCRRRTTAPRCCGTVCRRSSCSRRSRSPRFPTR